jgi:hypothetical protein
MSSANDPTDSMDSVAQCLRRAAEAELQAALTREQDYRNTLRAVQSVFKALKAKPYDAQTVEDLADMALAFIADQTGITPP